VNNTFRFINQTDRAIAAARDMIASDGSTGTSTSHSAVLRATQLFLLSSTAATYRHGKVKPTSRAERWDALKRNQVLVTRLVLIFIASVVPQVAPTELDVPAPDGSLSPAAREGTG